MSGYGQIYEMQIQNKASFVSKHPRYYGILLLMYSGKFSNMNVFHEHLSWNMLTISP